MVNAKKFVVYVMVYAIVIDAVNLTDYVDWLSAKLSLSEEE